MNNKQLSILPQNKTTVFYSPIEGKEVLVRTGIINEGSSFVHAVLHSYSQDYTRMSDSEKVKTAEKLSKNINDKVERLRWEDKFNIAIMLDFQQGLTDRFRNFYKCISGSNNTTSQFFQKLEKKDVDSYKVICEIVKLEHFTKDILPESYNAASNKSLEKFKEEINNKTTYFSKKIFDNLGNSIDKKRKKYCIDKVVNLASDIVEEVETSVFKKHVNSKNDSIVTVDSHTVNFISDRFNRNIYFLESSKRLPYRIPDVSYKKKKSIVVIWLGDYHYEPVGKLLSQNRIQREFNSDDELITTINTFLYKPRQVSEKYPHLTKYLTSESDESEREESEESESERSSNTETVETSD